MQSKIRKIIEIIILGESEKNRDTETRTLAKWISKAIFIVTIIIAIILFVDIASHQNNYSAGTFGDFFGGMLNPILTFLTFIALCITLIMQRVQLHDAKQEASRNADASRIQEFESTFFNMIQLHNQIVQELRFDIVDVATAWGASRHSSYPQEQARKLQNPTSTGRQTFSQMFIFIHFAAQGGSSRTEVYNFLQKKQNHLFGHYFRNLYQILKYLKTSSEQLNGCFDVEFYSSMLRAQLSADELRALLYNCDGDLVDDGSYRKLIIKFRFLEHLPLHFLSLTKRLVQADFSSFDSDLYEQYFFYRPIHGSGQLTSGAFGDNPAVKEYLKKRTPIANIN